MTLKTFAYDFRRGLGSAIIELKNNPEREKYRDIVLRYCLKDIAYDTQAEGTKGFYLYTAINCFDKHEDFLNTIIEKFNKKLYWRLSEQLYDILVCFSEAGNKIAEKALEEKYIKLKKRLPLMREFNLRYCEREQFEHLMIKKSDSSFKAFKQCINDMGEMILKRGNNECLWYNWFLENAENKYGESIYTYIKSEENVNIIEFYKAYSKSKSKDLNDKIVTVDAFCQSYNTGTDVPKNEKITIKQLIDYANKIEKTKSKPFSIRMYAIKFAKQANKSELNKLGAIALDESSDLVKAALLFTFNFTDFPHDVELLFPYVFSDCRDLRYIAVEALSRITDKKINALVFRLFNEGQIENAIALLKSNFTPEEEPFIRKYVKSKKNILHGIITDIAKIYNKYKSETCGDILLHLYKNTECTHCRYNIVEAMIKNNVLPKNILEECRYDSYNETRKILKNEGKTVKKR